MYTACWRSGYKIKISFGVSTIFDRFLLGSDGPCQINRIKSLSDEIARQKYYILLPFTIWTPVSSDSRGYPWLVASGNPLTDRLLRALVKMVLLSYQRYQKLHFHSSLPELALSNSPLKGHFSLSLTLLPKLALFHSP